MDDETNPYHSPRAAIEADRRPDGNSQGADRTAWIGWPLVFVLNMIVPVMFGWSMTREQGRIGMCLAAALLLAAGWVLCHARPSVARKLIFDSMLVAVSQLFPVLQLVAG